MINVPKHHVNAFSHFKYLRNIYCKLKIYVVIRNRLEFALQGTYVGSWPSWQENLAKNSEIALISHFSFTMRILQFTKLRD